MRNRSGVSGKGTPEFVDKNLRTYKEEIRSPDSHRDTEGHRENQKLNIGGSVELCVFSV